MNSVITKHLLQIIIWLLALGCIVLIYSKSKTPDKTYNVSRSPVWPERIISLAPNITEILFALGLDDQIVAVSSDSDTPDDALEKQKVGTFWRPNTEVIIASKPDLVVTLQFEQQKAAAESLGRLGYHVLTLKIEKTEDLISAIEKIGEATHRKDSAKELIEDISNQLDDLKARFSSDDKVKVLWVIQNEPLRVVGRNTFINEIIELAGGENAIGPTIQKYPAIGTEVLMTSQAQVIIQSAMAKDDIDKQTQRAEKFWSKMTNLPAVKNNRIFVIDSDNVLRLGPGLPDGVRLIGHCLHQLSPKQKHESIQQSR
ncbi:ABC transporter substrate-binding protein [Planctomycetota bacterium]